MIVDASALIRALADGGKGGDDARGYLGRAVEMHAPAHIIVESVHALRRLVHIGELPLRAGGEYVAEVIGGIGAGVVLHSERDLVRIAWELRDTFATYDAVYVALAQRLRMPLLTGDLRLARAAAALVDVIPIGET